jgi:hypothetical protein
MVVLAASAACSFGTSGALNAKSGGAPDRNREIVHEPCNLEASSAERIDANGDGKIDVTVVSDGGKEHCRAADLDFDGRIDLYTYQDSSGRIARRELDYDRDGNIDEIQLFKNGEISEKQRSTTLAKRLDTWETYVQGRLVKAERDSDGNGRIDQWWDYKTSDCPIIRSDIDGNGEPDPTSQVDFCSEAGYKPPEQAAPATAPMLQKDTQALPTETSNKAEGEPDVAPKSDAAKSDAPKSDVPKSDAPKSDAPKSDAPDTSVPKGKSTNGDKGKAQ